MKTGLGMWIMILGILGIIVGGVVEVWTAHHTIGWGGIGLGIVLLVVGAAWWMMGSKSAPTTTAPQPTQPAKTP